MCCGAYPSEFTSASALELSARDITHPHLSQHTWTALTLQSLHRPPSPSPSPPSVSVPGAVAPARRAAAPIRCLLEPSILVARTASASPLCKRLGLRRAFRGLPANNSCAQQLHPPSALLATLISAATAPPVTLSLTSVHLPVPSRERPSAPTIPTTFELPTSQPQQRAQNAARTREAQLVTTATAESTLQRHRHA